MIRKHKNKKIFFNHYFFFIFLSYLLISKFYYNFYEFNLNYNILSYKNFLIIFFKEFLIIFFIIFALKKIDKEILKDYFKFLSFIYFAVIFIILIKFVIYDFIDQSYLVVIKNLILPSTLIFLPFFISFDFFIKILKFVILILGLLLIFQIFYIYPDTQNLSLIEKNDLLSGYYPGFISGRAIGFFGSPNSLAKFAALSLIIIFFNEYYINVKKYNFIFNYRNLINILIFFILTLAIYYAQTISVYLALTGLFFFNLIFAVVFNKRNKTKLLFITFLIILFLIICYLLNKDIILFLYNRIYDFVEFISYISNLSFDNLVNFSVNEATDIKDSYGTFAERFYDFTLFYKCFQNNMISAILIGCNYRYDTSNIGYLNLFMNYGILFIVILFSFLSYLIVSHSKIVKRRYFNSIKSKTIFYTSINLFVFILFLTFPSKIIEISVVNYLIFIILGYFLKLSFGKENLYY